MENYVYVVEDDANIREVVQEYLKASGFRVRTAADGAQAMDLVENPVEREAVDLFILDIMLPSYTGTELLTRIRAYGRTPVIMLTALDDEYTQITSFNHQADDYVTKPFSPKVLIKRVEALLRRTGDAPFGGAMLQIADIALDTEAYTASENGSALPLTLKEYEILKILMTHEHKALSRQQLLDMVWGYDFFGDERIVDVHIKNLRKKLQKDPIVTVKGVGYRLDGIRREALE